MPDSFTVPIARVGLLRDRPLEAARFDRIEEARDGGHHHPPRERTAGRRPSPQPPHPAPADGDVDPPTVGSHLDVRV